MIIHERAARSAERLVDAPGRRDKAPKVPLGGLSGERIQSFAKAKLLNPFCHEVAKSNDNARAEGAYNGIVSLHIHEWGTRVQVFTSFRRQRGANYIHWK